MLIKPFEVRYDELDAHTCVSPLAFLRYFQEAAALDAASMAYGWEKLQQSRLAWVLTHMQLEMLGPGAHKQTVNVKTWHAFSDKILSRREFEITGRDGQPVARGSSWWLLMDIDKRRITKNPPELLALNPQTPHYIMEEENFKRPLPENAPQTARLDIAVRREDLDINGHVNNTHYAAWALESAPESKRLKKLLINFKNECRAGENITVCAYAENEHTLHHTLTRASDGKEAARAVTQWQ